MKLTARIAILMSMLFMACSHKETVMTDVEIKAKADSIVAGKTVEINKQAAEDLDRRISIEVKAKADSIVEAWQHKRISDSTTNKP